MQEEYRPPFEGGENGQGEPMNHHPENPMPTDETNTQSFHQPQQMHQNDPYSASPNPQPQWTYCDYGPIGGTDPQQPPKKEKKPGMGLRVFAIVMSVLFVLSAGGFAAVLLGGTMENTQKPENSEVSGPLFQTESTPDGTADDEIVEGQPLTNSQIYRKVEPAVVGIVGYVRGVTGTQPASQGSGVVFREDGYIVTNNHVVTDEESGAVYDKIEVILSNGDSYIATFIGGDRQSDLAVLKVDATGMHAAVFGDSDKLEVGDEAIVIGNPSGLALAGSFTHGYISALNRSVYVSTLGSNVNFIQTDAAINPGNSGGALVNKYGQVVGITSAKLAEEGFEGIGFAIPVNDAKPIIESLIQSGYVTGRVYIGITYRPISETIAELNSIPRGLRVIAIDENADVAKQGLQVGDIITKLDNQEVYDTQTVDAVLVSKSPGDTILLTVYRVNEETGVASTVEITAVLAEKTA